MGNFVGNFGKKTYKHIIKKDIFWYWNKNSECFELLGFGLKKNLISTFKIF